MSWPWNRLEREVTPENTVQSRRRWLKAAGLGGLAIAGGAAVWWWNRAPADEVLGRGRYVTPMGAYYPGHPNPDFRRVDRPITDEVAAARTTNFYEFSTTKQVWRYVEPFQPVPWKIEVAGLVERPRTYDVDDLVREYPLEERVYRHRCVEAWAMVVPWTGIPLAALLGRAGPKAGATHVRFVSFLRPSEAGGQNWRGGPWPYTEGLTLAEAVNELTFLATGMYGHPLLKQHGAPVRLVVPWKYGYKSIKSVTRIEVTDRQPATFWNSLQPREYGFESNVDPAVPHPRWSQASETMLGTGERFPTQKYNGYGEWVGELYG